MAGPASTKAPVQASELIRHGGDRVVSSKEDWMVLRNKKAVV